MASVRHPDRLGLHVRVVLPGGVVIGPGRADLLQAIRTHGSIASACRDVGMSYKRAWDLVADMNAAFREPLVEAIAGGPTGGGARLTVVGDDILDSYRRLQAKASSASASEVEGMTRRLGKPVRADQPPIGG